MAQVFIGFQRSRDSIVLCDKLHDKQNCATQPFDRELGWTELGYVSKTLILAVWDCTNYCPGCLQAGLPACLYSSAEHVWKCFLALRLAIAGWSVCAHKHAEQDGCMKIGHWEWSWAYPNP